MEVATDSAGAHGQLGEALAVADLIFQDLVSGRPFEKAAIIRVECRAFLRRSQIFLDGGSPGSGSNCSPPATAELPKTGSYGFHPTSVPNWLVRVLHTHIPQTNEFALHAEIDTLSHGAINSRSFKS